MALKILHKLISFACVATLAWSRRVHRSIAPSAATEQSHAMAPRSPVGSFGLLAGMHRR
jgi:hypothetical protein